MDTTQSCLSPLCLQPVSAGPSGSGGGGVLGSIVAPLMWLVSLVVALFKFLGGLLPTPAARGDGSGQGAPPQEETQEGRWVGTS